MITENSHEAASLAGIKTENILVYILNKKHFLFTMKWHQKLTRACICSHLIVNKRKTRKQTDENKSKQTDHLVMKFTDKENIFK